MLSALEQQLQLRYFLDNGFQRKQCRSCQSWFWTLEAGRTVCGDAPCVEYTFIERPLAPKPLKLAQMRETFQSFFEQRGHTRVPRYPVVARWREDIYLTIASIADFQPWVTSGQAPPPANPLVISQPCIRLNDLANVGKSGRHFTTFEMMAHHAFNYPGKEVYWADQTVAYCDEFLTKTLRFPREAITYKENPWAGGGNAGPAVEVLAGGLEVATLVFMNLKTDPAGTVEVKGEKYSPLDLKIVDTGWGLERLTWSTQGTPTAYDAVFPELVEFVRHNSQARLDLEDPRTRQIVAEHARLAGVMSLDASSNLHELRAGVARRLQQKINVSLSADELDRLMSPIENAYALSDHAKCLAFMLGDGIVPSNAKAGYLARLIVRRSLRLMESLGFQLKLRDLVLKEMEFLSAEFPELRHEEATVAEILDLESERYKETIEKGTRLIQGRIKRGQTITTEQLLELYDSQGMPPQVVRQVAESLGAKVDIPDAFDVMVAERHSKEKAPVVHVWPKVDVPPTRQLYYEEPDTFEFDASVLWSSDEYVVLEQTLFYPEGGGQPCDLGTLTVGDTTYKVKDVQRHDGVIFHRVEKKLRVGELVHGRIDRERRVGHMRHHTATHIVNGAARAILGDHVWQTGAQKSVDSARIDLTHYKRITPEELRKIEALANDVVGQGIPLDRAWLERDKAEQKYGVRLYQGGVAPGGRIRVIRIGHHDVEACGGTHAPRTSDVGPVKIIRSERIQDGVERLEYVAGPKAIEYTQKLEELLRASADKLSIPPDQLPQTVERFFEEWKQRGKEIEALKAELSELQFERLIRQAEAVDGVRLVTHEGRPEDLQALATRIAREPDVVAVLGGADEKTARVIVVRGPRAAKVHAGEIVKLACARLGGSGGGKPEMAQGGGPKVQEIQAALKLAADEVRRRLH
jgi:alanyl-tRNA synthetase